MDTLLLMPRTGSSKSPPDFLGDPASPSPRPGQPATLSFEVDAGAVLAELSLALRRLIEALPGPIERAGQLEKVLKINYNIAWRTLAVARADPPLAAGSDVPLPGQFRQLLAAAAKVGVKASIRNRLEKAYVAFEHLVQRHAGKAVKSGSAAGKHVGGRAMFDALLGGLNGETAARQEVVHRRATFKGNSYLWGVQARTTLFFCVFHQGESPGTVDSTRIKGFAGLHALRKNAPAQVIVRSTGFSTPAKTDLPLQRNLIAAADVRILDEFSTSPMPLAISSRKADSNWRELALNFEDVGRASMINVFHTNAEPKRNVNEGASEVWHGMMKLVETPTETLLLDLLVPRGWTDPTTLRVSTHGNPALFETLPQRVPEFELPIHEKGMYLGNELAALETADVPRHVDMVRHVLGDVGWLDTDYDIFRCRVRFPIMQTLVHMRVDTIKP